MRRFYNNGKRGISVGKSSSEIKDRLDAVYNDYSPLMATIKHWLTSFHMVARRFLTSRSGVRKTNTMEDNVTKVQDWVLTECRLKLREIAGRVDHILYEIL